MMTHFPLPESAACIFLYLTINLIEYRFATCFSIDEEKASDVKELNFSSESGTRLSSHLLKFYMRMSSRSFSAPSKVIVHQAFSLLHLALALRPLHDDSNFVFTFLSREELTYRKTWICFISILCGLVNVHGETHESPP